MEKVGRKQCIVLGSNTSAHDICADLWGTAHSMKAVRNGGGFYIDVGASELIISGEIKLRSGVSIEHILLALTAQALAISATSVLILSMHRA